MERRTEAAKIIDELAKSFPKAFSTDPSRIRPLAVGIKEMLFQRYRISPGRIVLALRYYTGSAAYLKAIVEGAVRVDLEGAPAGIVTTHHIEHARRRLAKITGNHSERLDAPRAGLALRAPSIVRHSVNDRSSVKRVVAQRQTASRPLGLADLKRAAVARRAAAQQIGS